MTSPSRKELKRVYKEKPRVAGVFQIRNIVSGKILLGSSLNIDGPINAHKFMLASGTHRNQNLQKDFQALGEAAFSFDILATVSMKDDPDINIDHELQVLEALWLDELEPVGENGYNKNSNIRQA